MSLEGGKRIKRVEYGWFYTVENGSEYGYLEVGKNGVCSINAFWDCCEAHFEDGHIEHVKNIHRMVSFPQTDHSEPLNEKGET